VTGEKAALALSNLPFRFTQPLVVHIVFRCNCQHWPLQRAALVPWLHELWELGRRQAVSAALFPSASVCPTLRVCETCGKNGLKHNGKHNGMHSSQQSTRAEWVASIFVTSAVNVQTSQDAHSRYRLFIAALLQSPYGGRCQPLRFGSSGLRRSCALALL
jgi:hypothetical protein